MNFIAVMSNTSPNKTILHIKTNKQCMLHLIAHTGHGHEKKLMNFECALWTYCAGGELACRFTRLCSDSANDTVTRQQLANTIAAVVRSVGLRQPMAIKLCVYKTVTSQLRVVSIRSCVCFDSSVRQSVISKDNGEIQLSTKSHVVTPCSLRKLTREFVYRIL